MVRIRPVSADKRHGCTWQETTQYGGCPAARVAHLVYASDALLVEYSPGEIEDMYRMLHRAVVAKGLKVWEESLELWSSHPSLPRGAAEPGFPATPSMVFFGALVTRSYDGDV